MQLFMELVKKVVVLVLLTDLVLQLQSGKAYEPYLKMLVGVMVLYSLISGVAGVWSEAGDRLMKPLEDFGWIREEYFELENQALEQTTEETGEKQDIRVELSVQPVADIRIEDVRIGKVGSVP